MKKLWIYLVLVLILLGISTYFIMKDIRSSGFESTGKLVFPDSFFVLEGFDCKSGLINNLTGSSYLPLCFRNPTDLGFLQNETVLVKGNLNKDVAARDYVVVDTIDKVG